MTITQQELAKKMDGSKYVFGLDTFSIVSGLRQLADDLEKGDAAVQSVVVYRKNDREDFPQSALVMKFYETLADMPPRVREVKSLYSPESQFPVDTHLT
jgi:hypothetical protein